jgi:hypothetical protein
MILIGFLLVATWLAHAGALFLPATAVMDLLLGRFDVYCAAVLGLALLPQLVLIPWAWRDSACRIAGRSELTLWRLAFFFTGFVAVTAYLLRRRSGRTGT